MLTTAADSRKKFRGFKSERSKAVRQCLVEENKAVREMIRAWEEFDIGKGTYREDGQIDRLMEVVSSIRYVARDVEKFNIMMQLFEHEKEFGTKAGKFLSALINCCPEDGITIRTDHLERSISDLGEENTKNIRVFGERGVPWLGKKMKDGRITVLGEGSVYVGFGMAGGTIEVFGNVMDCAGTNLSGGRIIVHGNAGSLLGHCMSGGTIEVSGDAYKIVGGGGVGKCMQGGEIRIGGRYRLDDYDPPKRGRIFNKGKLIFDRSL